MRIGYTNLFFDTYFLNISFSIKHHLQIKSTNTIINNTELHNAPWYEDNHRKCKRFVSGYLGNRIYGFVGGFGLRGGSYLQDVSCRSKSQVVSNIPGFTNLGNTCILAKNPEKSDSTYTYFQNFEIYIWS